MGLKSLLIVLGLVVGTIAGPTGWTGDTTECSTVTCPDSTKFQYERGNVYEYQYAADLETSISGSMVEHSSLHMTATVQLEALSPCELALRLSDVSLRDSDPTDSGQREHVDRAWDFKQSMQKNSLRFAFRDGLVADICPETDEDTWVLNIKRGIISAFQNNQDDLGQDKTVLETDVTGTCQVEYENVENGWSSKKVKKIKDILSCTNRHAFETAFQSTPYSAPSSIQSLPLMKTTHECEQEVNSEKILTKSTCMETHIFRPFSRHHNGAKTAVTSTLTYIGTNRNLRTRQGTIERRSNLLFEHLPNKVDQEATRQLVIKTVQEICSLTTNDIRPEVPKLFVQMVEQMRSLDPNSLKNIHRSTGRLCDKAEKFFHDALPMLGTPASISLMIDLINKKDATDKETDVWLTSMAFITEPTEAILSEVKPLLQMNPPRSKAFLSVSSLVNTFCKQNGEACDGGIVRDIIMIFESNLNYNCESNNQMQYDKVMMALKAIGNTGNAEFAVATLNRCFMTEQNPQEIRIAAMQAFRRMPCSSEKDELMNLFSNSETCSELRINAYLMLMECPTKASLMRVTEVLEKEEINQVGSFVWTHLTNLMETHDVHKQDIRAILENEELKKIFNLNPLKYSRNFEWSYSSDILNAGAKAESNLIFSTKSFVPRSANLNLTVDVFGKSVNLFEVGGRVEGVESILEKYFGDAEKNDIDDEERSKRSALNSNDVNILTDKFDVKQPDSVKGSYYLKIFGNEIRYDDFQGLDMAALKDKLNFLDWLIELAKEHEIDFTKSMMFLDTDMKIPTIAGMPLCLGVDGSMVMDMKMKGKLDIRRMSSAPRSMYIGGSIKPSAALEVSAEMMIDAFVAQSGMKMVNTLHTSTVTDGLIELKDGKIFNFDLNMPQDQVEIFKADTKFYVTYKNDVREQAMITEGKVSKSMCTGAKLETALGIQLCGEVSFPYAFENAEAPWYPMTGPASTSLVLHKKDTFSGFHFDAERKFENNVRSARVSFNTPGSRVDREMTFDFKLDKPNKQVSLKMKSPWKKVELEAEGKLEENLKSLFMKAVLDDRQEYSAKAEIQIERRLQTIFTPYFEVNLPNKPRIVKLQGTIAYRDGKKFEPELTFTSPLTTRPISLKGSISKTDNKKRTQYESNLEFTSDVFNGKYEFVSNLEHGNKKNHDLTMLVSYTKGQGPEHTFKITGETTLDYANVEKAFTHSGELVTTQWPQYNQKWEIAASNEGNVKKAKFDIYLVNDMRRRVTFNTEATYRFTAKTGTIDGDVSLVIPFKNINYKGEVQHSHRPDLVDSTAKLDLGQGRDFMGHWKRELNPIKYSADFTLNVPGREMAYHDTYEVVNNEHHHTVKVQLDKYSTVEARTVYKKGPRHEITSDISIPYQKPIHIEGNLSPDFMDFGTGLKVMAMGSEYSADLGWNHKGSLKSFQTTGTMSLGHPSRHIETTISASRRYNKLQGGFETLWDAKRDQEKKVKFDVDFTVSKTRPTFKLRTDWYPRQFVQVDISGENDFPNLVGSFKGQSSYNGFNSFGANFDHKMNPSKISTSMDTYWGNNKKIEGEVTIDKLGRDWSNVKSRAKITTPFSCLYTVSSDLAYNLQSASGVLDISTNIAWNRDNIDLTLNGRVDPRASLVEGTTTIKSSLYGMQDLMAYIRHSNSRRAVDNELKFSWAQNRIINTIFHMEHNGNIKSMTNFGSLTVKTPFPGHHEDKISWNHQHGGNRIESTTDFTSDIGNGKFVVSGSVGLNTKLMVSAITPFFDAFKFDFTHDQPRYGYRDISTEVTGTYGRKTISLKNEFSFEKGVFLNEKMTFTSPFPDYALITMETVNTVRGRTDFTTHNEAKWGRNQKMSLDGNMKIGNDYMFNGDLRITSPWDKFERLVLEGENKKEGNTFITSASLELSPRQKYSVVTRMEYMKLMSVNVKSPHQKMRDVTFEVSQDRAWPNLVGTLKVENSAMPENIVATIKLDVRNTDNIHAEIDIKGPHPMNIAMDHEKKGRERYVTKANFRCPMHTINAEHDLSFDGQTYYKCQSKVVFDNKNYELDTDFRATDKYVAKLNLRTPHEMARDVSYEYSYTPLRSGKYESYQKFVLAPNKIAEQRVSYTNNNGRKHEGMYHYVNTLHQPSTTIDIDFEHSGNPFDFNSKGGGKWNDKEIRGDVDFNLNPRSSTMTLEANLNTPFENYEANTLTVTHRGPKTDFKTEGSLRTPKGTISAIKEFKLGNGNMMSKLEITTPFRKFPRMVMEVNHNGPWNNFKIQGTLQLPSGTISAIKEFQVGQRNMRSKLEITTPFRQFPSLVMEIDHNGNPLNYQSSADLQFAGKRMTSKTVLKQEGNTYTGEFDLTTPFQKVKSFKINFSHSGRLPNIDSSVTVEHNGKSATGLVEFSKSGMRANGKIDLKLPFNRFDSLVATLNHKGSRAPTWDSKVTLEVLGRTYSIESDYKNDKAVVFGLLAKMNTFTVNIKHKGKSIRQFTNNAILKYGSKKIQLTSEMSKNDNKATITLRTPFNGLEETTVTLQHIGNPSEFTSTAKLEHGSYPMDIAVTHKNKPQDLVSSITLNTPFRRIPSLKMDFNRQGHPLDFKSGGSIEYSGKRITGDVDFKKSNDAYQGGFSFKSPYENWGLKEYTGRFSHEGSYRKFASEASLNTGVRGFEAFKASIDHEKTPSSLKSAFSVETPFPGHEKYSINTNGVRSSNRYTKETTVTTPSAVQTWWPSHTITATHSGDFPKDFETTLKIADVRGRKIETGINYKFLNNYNRGTYEAGFNLDAPFMERLDMSWTHNKDRSAHDGDVTVRYGGAAKVDALYKVDIGNPKKLEVEVRSPRPLKVNFNHMQNPTSCVATYEINWDTTSRGKSILVEMNTVYEDQKKEVTMKATMPWRTVTVSSGFTKSPFTHFGEFQWEDGKKIRYDVSGRLASRRAVSSLEGTFALQSPVVNFDGSINHRQSGNRYNTEVRVNTRETLVIKHDLTLNLPQFASLFTVQHPRMSQDATLRVDGTMDVRNKILDGVIAANYGDESFEFKGRIADETRGVQKKFVTSAQLSHPKSLLNMEYSGIMEDTAQNTKGVITLKYQMSRDRSVKTLTSSVNFDKYNREMTFDMNGPENTFKFVANKRYTYGKHQVTFNGNFNEKPFHGEANLHPHDIFAEMKLHYGPEDMFHAYGKYEKPSSLMFESYRQGAQEKVQDALASIDLQTSNLLKARGFIRPDLGEDIKKIAQTFQSGRPHIAFFRMIQEDWPYKQQVLSRSTEPLRQAYDRTSAKLKVMYGQVKQGLRQMYARDEFFMKTTNEAVKAFSQKYLAPIKAKMDAAFECVQQRFAEIGEKMQEVRANFAIYAERVRQNIQELVQEVSVMVNTFVETVKNAFEEVYSYIKEAAPYVIERLEKLKEMAKGSIMDLVDRLRSYPQVQAWIDHFASLPIQDYLRPLRYARFGSFTNKYQAYLEKVEEMWEQLKETPRFKNFVIQAKEAVRKSKMFYDYLELEETALGMIGEIYDGALTVMKARMFENLDDYLRLDKTKVTHFADGDLQVQVYVPWELKDLHTMPWPSINIQKYLTRFRNVAQRYLPAEDWSVWDTYYYYKPPASLKDLIPPFDTHATLGGAQHFMTFDKKFYEFSGECSYLLAHDFIDGNFSVIVNYDNVRGEMTKKSITVISNDRQLEISTDSKVLLDGQRIELPIKVDNTVIVRDGNLIRLENNKGLKITCDLPHDRCTVDVSGWYFGKTGGLFGTYDNEPATDFITSDKSRVSDISEFAASWGLGRRCRPVNNARNVMTMPDNRRYKICAKYFEDELSTFRPCFKQVDNHPFMKMCLNDAPINNRIETEEDICNVASFYVNECKRVGVPIKLPKACVKCQVEDGPTFYPGEEVTLRKDDSENPLVESSDVVIVVDHAECAEPILEKMSDFVNMMEKSLKAIGQKDNRFGLVGFGGKNFPEAQSHTMDGQLFNNKDKFQLGIDSFKEIPFGENGDALAAIQFATHYPFRAGISKTIVLIPCTSCREDGATYTDVQKALLKMGIKLHILTKDSFRVRSSSNSPKTPIIYGADNEAVFTSKDWKRLAGDKEMRPQLIMPKDICVALTEESDGSVFIGSRLATSRNQVQKRFLDVFTRIIAKKAEPSSCQTCVCVEDNAGVGKSICHSCDARNPIYSYVPQFEDDYTTEAQEPIIEQKMEEKKQKVQKKRKGKKAEAL